MEYKDYYKILGVEKNASPEEIKKKYRKLARQHHPDVNPDNAEAEARFKELSEAYEVLNNPQSRKQYDQLGANWKQYQQAGQGAQGGFDFGQWARSQGSGGGYGSFEGDADFSDFFSAFFGGGGQGGRRGGARFKGQDLRASLQLSLEQAFHGGPHTINLGNQQLRLTLKPGLQDGQTLRLKGKGAPGPQGGDPGDLHLTFEITPHPHYTRRGDDLHQDLKVPLYTCLLGGQVRIPALGGEVKVTLPPETPNGHVMRLRNKGMPRYDQPGTFGDMYVKLHALLPASLTEEEKVLFSKLAALRHERAS